MNVRRLVGLGLSALLVSGGLVMHAQSAGASSTVDAQLSLSGVVTADSPTGGSVIGIHPGDAVNFTASTAPTAGLKKLGLDGLLGGLVNGVAGYQVKVHFGGGFGASSNKDVVLKSGSGANAARFAFPSKGTFSFSWTAQSVTVGLLGTTVTNINLDGNALKQAGVALNASNQYVGKVVVADSPPAGGIAVQLPSVSASPSAPVVGQLPGVGVPGVTTPTLPNVGGKLPGTGSAHTVTGTGSHSGTTGGPTLRYRPTGQTVADKTMPKGYGAGSGVGGSYVPPGLNNSLNAPGVNGVNAAGSAAKGAATTSGGKVAPASPAPSAVDLASSSAHSAVTGLPALLIVLAVIALSAATAMYARTYLLHRPVPAKVKH
ncbi:hypothetical protein M6D93_00625 [Jatrophihabitans telluris]|uniref:Htaa domain-containing protein n=1 Tax=Jatrophihabitans telluris TaxID=2038343 RepID=A0ABY4R0D5_9ACTN|nr:hypothetical protein [Jatrophihabitans telluris]UQX88524.1 hypothetical protein M6D93_00625 [Jatrophihabitans telluris]